MRKMNSEGNFFRNMNFTLSDNENLINYTKMIKAHAKLNITYFEIY